MGQKICIMSPDPGVVRLTGPENLLNFKPSILVERKASCRFVVIKI